MNLCRACNQDFSSVKNFDRHRVGKHEYLFSADHLDGRRCLDIEEMTNLGWTFNERKQWHDPIETSSTRLWATSKRIEGSP